VLRICQQAREDLTLSHSVVLTDRRPQRARLVVVFLQGEGVRAAGASLLAEDSTTVARRGAG